MGFGGRALRGASLCVCRRILLCVSVRAVVGVDPHGVCLLGERLVEHQRGVAQSDP